MLCLDHKSLPNFTLNLQVCFIILHHYLKSRMIGAQVDSDRMMLGICLVSPFMILNPIYSFGLNIILFPCFFSQSSEKLGLEEVYVHVT